MKLAERPLKTFYNRFSIDKLTKYTQRSTKTLPEMVSKFPGYGEKFKVFYKNWKDRYYIIEDIEYKDNRHCRMLGIKYYKSSVKSKVVKIKNILKKGLWGYSIPDLEYKTDNGVVYNVSNMEKLMEAKKDLLKERNMLIGRVDYFKMKAEEIKKKKEQDKKKKK
jgi:hypothetical protein